MSLSIAGRDVGRIAIIDDDKAVRQSYEMSIHELGLLPVNETGPLGDLDDFAPALASRADAAVCDFKLRVKKYASFDGAALVARWYEAGFPALLCTRYDRASVDEIRRFRSKIPVMLTPNDLDPERIVKGIATCVRELNGEVAPSRRLWRTVVRVEDVSAGGAPSAYVVVPAWNPNESIRLLLQDVPDESRNLFRPEARLFAKVNLGAEGYDEVYFDEWHAE